MKKIVFWLLTFVGVFLVFKICQIIYYSHQMSDFVFGYLVGQIILLIIVIILSFILGRRIFKA